MPRLVSVKVPHIRVIQAGGTLDKDYLPTENSHGQNFVIGVAAFHAIWKRAGSHYSMEFTCACQKDSLHMDDGDRAAIRRIVPRHEKTSEGGTTRPERKRGPHFKSRFYVYANFLKSIQERQVRG